MPIYEYSCHTCDKIYEEYFSSWRDGTDQIECPVCAGVAERIISHAIFRMDKIFTAGGGTIHDKDGYESLGMTGHEAEASEKKERDKQQFLDEGKGSVMDFAIKESPVVSEE